MREVTLVFPVRDGEVMLAMKTRGGFGTGKWNGYGGQREEGETDAACAVRELQEEAGLVAREEDLRDAGLLHFHFGGRREIACRLFLLDKWEGQPRATDEMGEPVWFAYDALPLSEMWAADRVWVPLLLEGIGLHGDVFFSEDGSVMEDIRLERLER